MQNGSHFGQGRWVKIGHWWSPWKEWIVWLWTVTQMNTGDPWLCAILQYLQCVSNRDTAVLHWSIGIKTIQCHIHHWPCKVSGQIYAMTAELLLIGLVIMEWKQTRNIQLYGIIAKPDCCHWIEIGWECCMQIQKNLFRLWVSSWKNIWHSVTTWAPAVSELNDNLILWPKFQNILIWNPKASSIIVSSDATAEYAASSFQLLIDFHVVTSTLILGIPHPSIDGLCRDFL